MLVQRVLTPDSSLDSWTVLGDGGPVEPIERYLAYLTDIERSPNTIKAYAHDLKDWFDFLDVRGLEWREVRLEDLGEFVAWLRLPPPGRAGGVAMLPSAQQHCSAGTVNRKLSAVGGLYTFHARHGVDLGRPGHRVAAGAAATIGVEAVPLSPQRREAGTAAGVEADCGREQPGPSSPPRRCRRFWMPAPGCGIDSCGRCCGTPGFGLVKP